MNPGTPALPELRGWSFPKEPRLWKVFSDTWADVPLSQRPAAEEALDHVAQRLAEDQRAREQISHPADSGDLRTARQWEALEKGSPSQYWTALAGVEKQLLPQARRVFCGVLMSLKVQHQREVVLERLQVAYLPQLLGKKGEAPGWREIGLRALESAGDPLQVLADRLDAEGWRLLCRGVCRRGSLRESLRRLWPRIRDREHRAVLLQEWLDGSAARLRLLWELHLVLHLLGSIREHPEILKNQTLIYHIVQQQRGRAVGRLRALLLARGAPLHGLAALPGLRSRLAYAARRHAWAWAWSMVTFDFVFADGQVTAPCVVPAPLPGPLPGVAGTWYRRVVLTPKAEPLLDRWLAGFPVVGGLWERLRKAPPEGLAPRWRGRPDWRGVRRFLAPQQRRKALRDGLVRQLAGPWPLRWSRKLGAVIKATLAADWASEIPQPRGREVFRILKEWEQHESL